MMTALAALVLSQACPGIRCTLGAESGGTGQTSVCADNETMVSNGTAYQCKAIPSCTGLTDALSYDSATNTFGCNVGLGGGPIAATYIVQVADPTLTAEQAMGALGTGIVINTTTTGVQSIYGGASCAAGNYVSALNASGAATCAVDDDVPEAADLPNPGAGTKGGVSALTCSGTDKLKAIGTDGLPVCAADETSAGGGYATVREETSALTQRAQISFVGPAVTCADDGVTPETDCTVVASGTGTCTNQFVRVLNNGAAPTCATVAAADVAADVATQAELDQRVRSHATDCTALATGVEGDLCTELDSERHFVCQPTAGGCDTAAEWIQAKLDTGQLTGTVTDAQLASSYSGVGACAANTWVSTLNDNAAPTCTQPGVSDLSASTSASLRTVLSDETGTGAAMFGLTTAMADDLSCTGSQVVRRNAGDTAFECATISGGSGASLTRISGTSGAAGADLTWQTLTANSTDCTTTALCTAAMTTTGVGAGVWSFRYRLIYQTAATGTGIAFGINHTGTATMSGARWTHITTGGAAATGIGDDVAATVAGQMVEGKSGLTLNAVIGSASAGVITVNANHLAILEGVLEVTATGSLELKLGSEVGGSAVRIMDDSNLELHKLE